MPLNNLKEAERVMVVCNACRYCEGFCAVFPAMERRRTFSSEDLQYLANLCHNCRDCYYACQYAPPHQFDLNIPNALGELRLETYQTFAWPPGFGRLFERNGRTIAGFTIAGILLALLLTFISGGFNAFRAPSSGPNGFYALIDEWLLIGATVIIALAVAAALLNGFLTAWRATGREMNELLVFKAHRQAIGDVLRLKYLEGGGHGCNYPDDRFRMIRKNLHHFVFYGFLLCFAATTVAAFYDHFLDWLAPYPYLSWPVALGTLGGAAMLIGTAGLLLLKAGMDRRPAPPSMLGMDLSFLILLFLVSLTGLLLLALRETSWMGALLVLHVGLVFGFLLSLPYGKFVHGVYRYAALLGNAVEQFRSER